jgi:DNA-binding Lrp family transcriptional regulator
MRVFQDWEIRLLKALDEPLPLVARPFAELAERARIAEELQPLVVLRLLLHLVREGAVRESLVEKREIPKADSRLRFEKPQA